MYIVLEGIDRVGKSTQIKMLKNEFKDAIFTKEPGGTKFGEKIRDIVLNEKISPIAEIFLFLADRNEHFNKIIKPNLDKLIISDRGFISGIAYAHIKSDLDYETLFELNSLSLENHLPDKIIMFEIDKKELKNRFETQKLDIIEKKGIDFLLNVQKSMKEALKISGCKYIIIDASKPKNEINKIIIDFIKKG